MLGQNVNAYGVEAGDRYAFSKLLREVGNIDGLERIRFMSPHPKDFTDDVIEAMAQTPKVMPQLHMPLQSGSNKILQAMRRSYRTDRYLGILERVRSAMPHAAITTDIIVGFPGETEADHQETMKLCTEAQFTAAYTFQYSKRPGTPAATMADQVPIDVVNRRYTELHEHQNQISFEVNKRSIGKDYVALVSENFGERDQEFSRLSGRIEDGRLIHFAAKEARPGDFVEVKVDQVEPHYLIGTGGRVRRTRGGDVFENQGVEIRGTLLGMPKVRA